MTRKTDSRALWCLDQSLQSAECLSPWIMVGSATAWYLVSTPGGARRDPFVGVLVSQCMSASPLLLLAAVTTLTGPARVIDGDTLVILGQHIRLEAIDAPETRQVCQRDGEWRCGLAATEALKTMTGGAEIRCEGTATDRYQRLLATCWVGPVNLNAAMIRQGWALAYRHYSTRYAHDEADAKRNGAGIWASVFVPPWDWRRQQR